jgi:hypothetical protein
MEYGGKRTERFWLPQQLRVNESLGVRIRSSASEDGRSLQHHMGKLLEWGLDHRELILRHGKQGLFAHAPSHPVMPDFRREDHANTERTQDVTPRHAKPPVRVGQPQRKRGVA